MKLKEITPAEFMCHTSSCCPAVYESENDTYVIVGKKLSAAEMAAIQDRVADDEFAIVVEKGMIDKL